MTVTNVDKTGTNVDNDIEEDLDHMSSNMDQIPPMKKKDINLEGVNINIFHDLNDEFDDMSFNMDQIPFSKSDDIVASNEIVEISIEH